MDSPCVAAEAAHHGRAPAAHRLRYGPAAAGLGLGRSVPPARHLVLSAAQWSGTSCSGLLAAGLGLVQEDTTHTGVPPPLSTIWVA